MSTRCSLKYERDEATGREAHIYLDLDEPGYVLLEAKGFAFEVEGAINLSTEYPLSIWISVSDEQVRRLGLPANRFELTGQSAAEIRIKFPKEWARKLGLGELGKED